MIESALERIQALAEWVGDATAAGLARELSEQIPRGELNLLVLGQFKRGKSSLVNALLGDDVMPTGALPLTGVTTTIRYGDEGRIEVSLGSSPQKRLIAVDELPNYVTEKCNPANRLGVERVEILWPSERIRGFALFDTPGIGSTYAHNTAAAHAALPRADVAVLVVGPEPPIGAEELQYARDVISSSERLFVVLNKSDIAGEALPEILSFTRDALRNVLGPDNEVDVVPLSVTRAREAQRDGRRDSAFESFVESLRRLADHQGDAVREQSTRRRAVAIVERLDALAAMRVAALELPREERERRKAMMEGALQLIADRARALELVVDDDVNRLSQEMEAEFGRWYDRDVPLLRAMAAELSEESSSERRTERLESAIAARASAWRQAAVEDATAQLNAHAAKYGRLLGEIETSALQTGCEILRIDAGSLIARNIEFSPAKLDLATSVMPTTGLEIVVTAALQALPGPLRKPLLKRRYDDVLARELDALRGRLRYGVARDLEPWRKSVRAKIVSSIESIRHAILAGFTSAGEPSDPEAPELERARGLRRELHDLRSTLATREETNALAP